MGIPISTNSMDIQGLSKILRLETGHLHKSNRIQNCPLLDPGEVMSHEALLYCFTGSFSYLFFTAIGAMIQAEMFIESRVFLVQRLIVRSTRISMTLPYHFINFKAA